jgi:hypothetical protein
LAEKARYMRRLIPLFFCLSLSAPVSADPPKRHVLVVGDSEACRVGWSVNAAKLPDDDVSVECKVSTRVRDWAQGGLLVAALEKHPETDTVVVFLGTNDCYDQTVPDVQPILHLVTEQGVSCVWVGNVAVRGRRWPVNGMLHAAVTPTCQYFDTEAANIPLADGIHPTWRGAITWLRKVWLLVPPKPGVACDPGAPGACRSGTKPSS